MSDSTFNERWEEHKQAFADARLKLDKLLADTIKIDRGGKEPGFDHRYEDVVRLVALGLLREPK